MASRWALAAVGCVLAILGITPADARGGGRFIGGLLARGAARAAVQVPSHLPPIKNYTPDVLTVEQLASCIRKAGKLDEESDRLESARGLLRNDASQVELSSSMIEFQRNRVDTYRKASVDAFNRSIDTHNKLVTATKARQTDFNSAIDRHNVEANAYNTECAKKYFADDLTEAQKLAASN